MCDWVTGVQSECYQGAVDHTVLQPDINNGAEHVSTNNMIISQAQLGDLFLSSQARSYSQTSISEQGWD